MYHRQKNYFDPCYRKIKSSNKFVQWHRTIEEEREKRLAQETEARKQEEEAEQALKEAKKKAKEEREKRYLPESNVSCR